MPDPQLGGPFVLNHKSLPVASSTKHGIHGVETATAQPLKGGLLTDVGALRIGSIAKGFGAAHVAALTADGAAAFNGASLGLGDALTDKVSIRGHLTAHALVFDANSPIKAWLKFRGKHNRHKLAYHAARLLDTLEQLVQACEVVAFIWQTSHVGSPTNSQDS